MSVHKLGKMGNPNKPIKTNVGKGAKASKGVSIKTTKFSNRGGKM